MEDLPAEDRRLRGVTTGVLATAYLWSGQAAAASQAFAEAVARSRAEETSTLALFASGWLVQAQALQGQLHRAAATYQQTRDLAVTYELPDTPALGVAPVYVAALLIACGSAPQATHPAAALVEPLSAREMEVLRLLAAGLSTPEIAAQLYVTSGTVRSHLKSISRKLDVHSRLQVVQRARTLDLV